MWVGTHNYPVFFLKTSKKNVQQTNHRRTRLLGCRVCGLDSDVYRQSRSVRSHSAVVPPGWHERDTALLATVLSPTTTSCTLAANAKHRCPGYPPTVIDRNPFNCLRQRLSPNVLASLEHLEEPQHCVTRTTTILRDHLPIYTS